MSTLARASLGLVFLALTVRGEAEPTELFDRVELLTANGAGQLALKLLDNNQPPVGDTENWVRAEVLRFSIYSQQDDWAGLSTRLESIPAELPLIQQHRVLTNAVEIFLRSGNGDQGQKYLRELIWRGSGDSVQISYWRRLLIRGYLLEGQLDDAEISMERYQQEYAPADQNWSYLYGLTMLKSGAYEQAASRLALVQLDRARVLRLISRLRARIDDPKKIIDEARKLYRKANASAPQDRIVIQRLWALQAEAAEDVNDPVLRVMALEKLFSRPMQEDMEFPIENRPADLWNAYEALGTELGNQKNLLVGDFDAWRKRADATKKKNRHGARSIFALLALQSIGSEREDELNAAFYDFLKKSGLEYVAVSLYTEGGVFEGVDQVPPSVRHRVVRYAFQNRDVALAAAMAKGLQTTSAGQDPVEWKLIRARLAIYSGDMTHGEALLREIVTSKERFDTEQANRIVQVIFDLQSVDRFESAYQLLGTMRDRVTDRDHQREILFWMADSLKGMEDYELAAEAYIRSATYGDDSFDIWGQTARYHAAEVLTEGGMLEDARRLYEQLLRVTSDPGRVVALERKMQDLWLREQSLKEGESS